MPEITAPGHNPLKKYFRQPKVYIDIPSKGKYWPEGSINMPDSGELAVYAMTAKDELAIKTPDALLNGQATVDIIKSCVPEIIDPWQMPSIDLDSILIAIRIATYGEMLEVTTKTPVTGEDKTYEVDLRQILNKITNVTYDDQFVYENLTVKLKPLTYKEFTQSSLKTFEEQRVFSLVNNDTIPEEEKLAKFNQSFKKLTDLTVGTVVKSIRSIIVEGEEVSNPVHIDEFIQNSDKEFFNVLMEHLEDQKKKFAVEPLKINSTPEEIEQGVPESYEVPVTFDQSNFFG